MRTSARMMRPLLTCCLFCLVVLIRNVHLVSLSLHGFFAGVESKDEDVESVRTWPSASEKAYMYYIHVGKTGGITMETHMPIRIQRKMQLLRRCLVPREETSVNATLEDAIDACNYAMRDESALAKSIISHFHLFRSFFKNEEIDWILKHTNTFLFSVRSPVDRLVSAFNYHYMEITDKSRKAARRPRDKLFFYHNCFASMEELANALLKNADFSFTRPQAMTDRCRSLAWQALTGHVSTKLSHFKYNYQFYYRNTVGVSPDHHIVAVRTEHLWEDVAVLDVLSGGNGNFTGAGAKYTHGVEKHHGDASLSDAATRIICCALYDELLVYQNILLKAENLSNKDRRESLLVVLRQCQIDYDYDPVEVPFQWDLWFNEGDSCNSDPELHERIRGSQRHKGPRL